MLMRRLLAALLLCAPAAFANPFELFGFTPRAMGMGGTMTSIAVTRRSAFAFVINCQDSQYAFFTSSTVASFGMLIVFEIAPLMNG